MYNFCLFVYFPVSRHNFYTGDPGMVFFRGSVRFFFFGGGGSPGVSKGAWLLCTWYTIDFEQAPWNVARDG